MASIDKIYGTEKDDLEFRMWCAEHNPVLLSYFYPPREDKHPLDHRPITNFPMDADIWLGKYCNLEWVINQIYGQYMGELPKIFHKDIYRIPKIKPYIYQDVYEMDYLFFTKPRRETIFTFSGNTEYRAAFITWEEVE